MKTLMAAFAILSLVTAAPAATVAGTWSLSVDSPHGAMKMALVLKQDGTKVTGTFSSGHAADQSVEGEFSGATLKLQTKGGDDHAITFSATLKEDDTLAGFLSSRVGDMKWTAERLKTKGEKKDPK